MQDEQIQRYIQESSDRVADVGWDNADLKDVLMMGIGYMRPAKTSKKLLAGGSLGGLGLGAGVVELLRAVFGG